MTTAINGHLSSLKLPSTIPRMVTPNPRMVPIRRKCTTDFKFGTYTLVIKLTPGDNCHGWSHTIPRIDIHQPKDGHPPIKGWSPTRRKCTRDMELGTYSLITKLTPGDNCHKWSPIILEWSSTIPWMVTHQLPSEESVLQT